MIHNQNSKTSTKMERTLELRCTAFVIGVALTLYLSSVTSAPVKAPVPHANPQENVNDPNDVEDSTGLEYDRYLREVVSILEEDEKFRQKLENTSIDDIKTGAIAHQLEYVSHHIRTKLDELKRKEVGRLRELARQKRAMDKMGKVAVDDKLFPNHIDHSNPHTFETEDLKRLIKEATRDLEEQDKVRKEEFKRYEMEKEHRKREELAKLNEEERKKEKERLEKMDKKHKDHEKIHHPGSKDQLEEVWEETDHLDKDDFDPKTFFKLHDSNSDGYLDELEVEALFERELGKMYNEDNPEDDMVEKEEERNRMREHVFGEIDKDKDFLISMEEFMKGTQGENFEKDEGWKTVDDEEQFTEDELQAYEKEMEEIRKHEEEKKRKIDAKHQKAADTVKQAPELVHHQVDANVVKLEPAAPAAAAGHGAAPQGGPIHLEAAAPVNAAHQQAAAGQPVAPAAAAGQPAAPAAAAGQPAAAAAKETPNEAKPPAK